MIAVLSVTPSPLAPRSQMLICVPDVPTPALADSERASAPTAATPIAPAPARLSTSARDTPAPMREPPWSYLPFRAIQPEAVALFQGSSDIRFSMETEIVRAA